MNNVEQEKRANHSEDTVMLSILCIAYNQEKYIADALNGFLMQKTNFKFEVIVHDDASTDHTAAIIQKYEEQYPDVITAICQKENQYSKGVRITNEILLPKARGKYIAVCEGDDYWTEPLKLQKQVDILEQNPSYAASAHNTISKYMESGTERIQYSTQNGLLGLEEVVMRGLQSFHDVSLVYRKEISLNYPHFVNAIKGVGDYPKAIYYALNGGIYYFGNVMAVHRCEVQGSWGYRMAHEKNKKSARDVDMQTVKMLQMADEYSEYRYTDLFKKSIDYNKFEGIMHNGKLSEIFDNGYFKSMTILEKGKTIVKILLSCFR